MAGTPSTPWLDWLPLAAGDADVWTLRMRLVRKQGEPLLLLPREADLASAGLTLYPAQSLKARTARSLLRAGLSLAPDLVTESCTWTTAVAAPFVRFLAQSARTAGPPRFAAFLGNPRALGRRGVWLLFDERGDPAATIKLGVGETAGRLIEAELGFLKSQPAALLRAPTVRGEFTEGTLRAFAMDFVTGEPPPAGVGAEVIRILDSWLRLDQRVGFGELPVAASLAAHENESTDVREALRALRETQFHPALVHGDFAPWNVRVTAQGNWQVLDWERGVPLGPPAWDWFHWMIQPEILVRRTPTGKLAARVESLIHSAEFRQYAERAGIASIVRPLLVVYLVHCAWVIRQADGLAAIEALLAAFMTSSVTGRQRVPNR